MFVCSCFGITEQQVRDHAAAGACTPREIASRSKAGTDCGSCVRRIQGLLGRGAPCGRRAATASEERIGASVAAADRPAEPSPGAAPHAPAVPALEPAAA
ncbi:(2Fe-2S)-binding protein [Streptomyces otsuchiensis]|uniref:(2Fe-2S)-binding protein n=1 Tax=Streptomyces otsuchiensis TaxID=2681388 RepID=UPI00103278D8|nr:(2Fe-2S)-binding protein [Streptomyces otsuchiensis]